MEGSRKRSNVLTKVSALMTEHPEGVPLKTVTIKYSQKYHQNLRLSDLGFKTISCLVKFLEDDLVICEDRVFHKMHFPQKDLHEGPLTNTQEGHGPAGLKIPQSAGSDNRQGVPPSALGSSSTCSPGTEPLTRSRPEEQATLKPTTPEVSPVSCAPAKQTRCEETKVHEICTVEPVLFHHRLHVKEQRNCQQTQSVAVYQIIQTHFWYSTCITGGKHRRLLSRRSCLPEDQVAVSRSHEYFCLKCQLPTEFLQYSCDI